MALLGRKTWVYGIDAEVRTVDGFLTGLSDSLVAGFNLSLFLGGAHDSLHYFLFYLCLSNHLPLAPCVLRLLLGGGALVVDLHCHFFGPFTVLHVRMVGFLTGHASPYLFDGAGYFRRLVAGLSFH